jgi:Domain of unknown function (DUF397)
VSPVTARQLRMGATEAEGRPVAADELTWIKAPQSVAANACVELAVDGEFIALRNSRDPSVVLRFTPAEMCAFLAGAADGRFDHLVE